MLRRDVLMPLAISTLCAIATSALAAPIVSLSRARVDFGRIPPQVTSSVQPIFVTNIGDGPLAVQGLQITGPDAGAFSVAGTCAPSLELEAGARCRIAGTIVLTRIGPVPAGCEV